MRHTKWLLALLLLVVACQKGEDDTTAITNVRNAWAAAWKAGDAAKLAELYDENAMHMPNHANSLQGRIAIASESGAQFAQFTPNELVLNSDKTEVSGDLAYDIGTFQVSMTPKNGGPPMSDSGRYLVVLKKQTDGSWKIVADADNSATPLAAQQGAPQAPPATTTTTM